MRRSEDTTGRNRRRRIALVFDELPEAHAALAIIRSYHTPNESFETTPSSLERRRRGGRLAKRQSIPPSRHSILFHRSFDKGIVGRQLPKAHEAVPKAGLLKAR
jgi:hypothetical protein